MEQARDERDTVLGHGQDRLGPARHRRALPVTASYDPLRGMAQYYLLAGDVWRFDRPRWAMETSMPKTLTAKHRSTVMTMARTFKTVVDTPHGPHTCFQANIDRDSRQPLVARPSALDVPEDQPGVVCGRDHRRGPAEPATAAVPGSVPGRHRTQDAALPDPAHRGPAGPGPTQAPAPDTKNPPARGTGAHPTRPVGPPPTSTTENQDQKRR